MKYTKISVKSNEIERFLYTSDRYNTIRQFWINIVKDLPPQLRNEVKQKPTNLVEDCENCDKTIKEYYFETKNGSQHLLDFLSSFRVIVL